MHTVASSITMNIKKTEAVEDQIYSYLFLYFNVGHAFYVTAYVC